MVGGFLLRTVGMAGCFFINALSFVALIVALLRMKIARAAPSREPARFSDIIDGYCFVRKHETLWLVTLLVAVVSLFAMSFGALLPVFARDVFQTDERGFAMLMTCNGVGAMGSALSLAVAGKMSHKGKRLLLGSFLFCVSVMGFAVAPTMTPACALLILAGWFLLTFLMTANTMVQTLAPDEMRGRVFSVYSLALIGTAPIGAMIIGAAAKVLDARLAVLAGAGVAAICTLIVYLRFRQLWKEK
jgi:Na+/melibiose symporter-like transporter